MLKNVPKILSPELLKILCEMGHGDEIVIADGNFPSATFGRRVIRADGLGGKEMLEAILQMIPLDTAAKKNYFLMANGENEQVPVIWSEYAYIASSLDKNVRKEELQRYAAILRAIYLDSNYQKINMTGVGCELLFGELNSQGVKVFYTDTNSERAECLFFVDGTGSILSYGRKFELTLTQPITFIYKVIMLKM